MNSMKTFADIIAYLETVAESGSEIDFAVISQIAASPAALFQRIFGFVTGITMADYVRKRKLTLAGYDLQNTDISVLDCALQYGFQSHAGFTRAFKDQHAITPVQAKQTHAILNVYPPLNYTQMRFAGGKRIMAEVKKIRFCKTEERLMAGMHFQTSFSEAGKAWQSFFQSDGPAKLEILSSQKSCGDLDANAGIGLMYNFSDRDHFELLIGDFVKIDTDLPEGIAATHIPAGTAAYIQIEGNSIGDILQCAYLLITEEIEKSDWAIDFERFYWSEIYTLERYVKPMERGEKITIDYMIPVKASLIL